ncbi:ABC transporter permease [Anaerobacillus alkaliphilus]|uniref:ABC transporter permease n=1 Tax=Anaerobacillus alkaliphilus TaxID=1548597 RepID=A0A4Q0VPM1_9BACI|nr:ABC transporter permease [Anaerobacillus alkaliphilus]RXI98432.1 ABC transporter permease [Anaerobacillus alkaliphilus]
MKVIFRIAWKIIKEKRQRAFLLGGSTAVAAFLLFTSYFFIHSLNDSMGAIEGRLGADIIVVPKGMGAYAGENIVTGAVNDLYFDESLVVDQISKIDDITEWAPQLFLETISTSCCGTMGDFPVVAYDPERDFTLKTFMPGFQQLAENEIVIGIHAGGERFLYHYDDEYIKEKVMLFQEPFMVKNALFPTGTGADETIFMRLDTARTLIAKVDPLKHLSTSALSAIYINTTPHTQLFVKQQLELGSKGVDVVLGSGLKDQLQQQVFPLKLLSYIMIAVALSLTLLQVVTLFSALIRERQKEIGVLFALGVTKTNVYQLLLVEAAIVSIIGSSVGVLFSLSILYDQQTLLYLIFQLPLVLPDFQTSLMIGLVTIFIIMVCTIIAAFFPVRAFFSQEPYEVMTEGES